MNKIEHLPYSYADTLMEIESNFTFSVIVDAIRKYVPPGGKILDVGCGRGELMEMLVSRGYEVCGCDMDEECVSLSAKYGETRRLDVNEISPDTFGFKFDCVLLSHVLEHLDNPRKSLLRLASLTNDLIVLSLPNPYDSLSVIRALARREIKHMNTGHLVIWDWSHLRTFIEIGCDMKIIEFFYDSVALPLPNRVRRFLGNKGLISSLENKYMRAAFPRFCRSITAVISTNA